MSVPPNVFKQRLLAHDQQVGLFATLNSAAIVEMLAGWGFDWMLIDTEHSPTEMADVIEQLRVLDGRGIGAVVRPAWSDRTQIKRLLDAGARNLLIPSVDTADEAAAAVSYTRYPPEGVRGVSGSSRAADYGQNTGYLRSAADELCLLVQIETATALQNIVEIASVPGIDGVFIGPADLAASLGHLGDAQHSEVQRPINDAFRLLKSVGKPRGYLTLNGNEARLRIQQGIEMVGIATDTSILNAGAAMVLENARGAVQEAS
ncbi:MAG: aldolase/citrate lyase family protein [Actinomycetota bacterium]